MTAITPRPPSPGDVIRREDYGDLELDAKVELIRSLVPLHGSNPGTVAGQRVPIRVPRTRFRCGPTPRCMARARSTPALTRVLYAATTRPRFPGRSGCRGRPCPGRSASAAKLHEFHERPHRDGGPPRLGDASLAVYLGELFEAGRAPATAALAVAAVRFRAKLAGQPDPAGEATARVLGGYRRTAADRGRGQAAPLTTRRARPPNAGPSESICSRGLLAS